MRRAISMSKKLSPFREYGMIPWWCWTGHMKKPEMYRQMKAMKEQGIDEFFVLPYFALEYPRFLEKSWFDYMAFTLETCKKLDMRLWIYDDLNWPSGTAGGRMTKEHPEYRTRYLRKIQEMIEPGKQFYFRSGGDPLAFFTREKGMSDWQRTTLDSSHFWLNETGNEIEVLCLYIQFFNNTMLSSSGAEGTWAQRGLFDPLNPEAVKCWMGYIHERYYELFRDEFGKTIRGFFFDEPYACSFSGAERELPLPWTPGLDEMFRKKYGYDLIGKLPLIYENEGAEKEKVRCDYWELITSLMENGFGKILGDWCEKRGVIATGHAIADEIDYTVLRRMCNGEIHRFMKHIQAPGMDLLDVQSPFREHPNPVLYGLRKGIERNYIFTAKQASSTGRYSGAARVMAECMTVCSFNTALNDAKIVMEWLACCGINLMDDSGFIYTMSQSRKRALSNKHFTQPWFKEYHQLSDLVRRISAFAAQPLETEIAVLTPETTIRATVPQISSMIPWGRLTGEDENLPESMLTVLDSLARNHIDFELLFEDILEEGTVGSGILDVPNCKFRIIILPWTKILTPASAEKLAEFLRKGGTVIFAGCRPCSLSNGPLTDEMKTLFGNCLLLENAVYENKEFAGKLTNAIRNVPGAPEFRISGKNSENVFSAMRSDDETRTLFLTNQGHVSAECEVGTDFELNFFAEMPDSGEQWIPEFSSVEKGMKISVMLQPEQSVFLRFSKKNKDFKENKKPVTMTVPTEEKMLNLSNEWSYSLNKGNCVQLPFELGFCGNEDFSDPDKAVYTAQCSRDGIYNLIFSEEEYPFVFLRSTFTLNEGVPLKGLSLVADSDDCREVYLNGKKCPAGKPFTLWDHLNLRFDLSGEAEYGENTIVILMHAEKWHSARYQTPSNQLCSLNSIEPLVLYGDFAAEIKDRTTILNPMPSKILTGDFLKQGFPHFIGEVTYHTDFEWEGELKNQAIRIPEFSCTAMEILLNGKSLGCRVWGPGIFACGKYLKRGKNRLEIRCSGSLGALLRRRYSDSPSLYKPIGIFQKPTIVKIK